MGYNPIEASCKIVLSELQSLADPSYLEGMKRFAIRNDSAYGVKLPLIREFAKPLKKRSDRHHLAMQLWQSGVHEGRILASIIADPKLLTAKEMDAWVQTFDSWDICDQACGNLFRNTGFLIEKALAYSYAEPEFVKRCGFTLMAQYAQHLKKAPDDPCLLFLKRIEEEAHDNRNFVKKAVNWALREIAKRNSVLFLEADACAYRLLDLPYPSAKWIARDALREFSKSK